MSKKRKLTVAAGSALCALSACLALAACGKSSEHTVKEIQAKDATCTEAGNLLYYACTDDGCGKIFSDAEGKKEVSLQEVVKPALGHNPEKVEAEPATCTTDGHSAYYDCSRCDVNFADAAGTQEISLDEITIDKFDHDGIEEVEAVTPTLETAGNVYHWHCDLCEKDFTNRNANKEIEDVTIPKLVKQTGLTVSVTVYDENGAETSDTSGITLNLKGAKYADSATNGVTIANGKLSATELIADDYSFAVEGYYPVSFSVNETDKTYNIKLYKHFHKHTVASNADKVSYDYIDGDLKINFNDAGFNDGTMPIVNLVDDKITGDYYMTEFTLQYKNLSDWSWKERFAIKLGTSADDHKPLGLMFFTGNGLTLKGNEFMDSDLGLGEGTDNGRTPFELNDAKGLAIGKALNGDGLRVRAVRNGKFLTVRTYVNGEWFKIWEKTVEGLGTGISLMATSPNCTATVSDLKFFGYQAMTDSHFGHFYEGTDDSKTLYTTDGVETTLDSLVMVKKTVSVNVVVYNGVRNVIDAPSGLKLTLVDEYERDTITDATIVNGKLSATQFYPGKYLIQDINGYYAPGSLIIDPETGEYEIKLYQIDDRFTISGNNDNRVTPSEVESDLNLSFNRVDFNAYNPPVITLKNDKITGGNYMTEFTLKYAFEAGKSWNYYQRFAVRLGSTTENDKVIGFSFFAAGDAEIRFSYATSGDTGFGEKGTKQPFKKGSDEAKAFAAALKGNGVTFRAVRNGDKLYLRAKVGNEWILVYETDATGLGAEISISASTYGNDAGDNVPVCTVSGISFADGFVDGTAEKYAYFTKGGSYITEDGDDTTLEGLNVVAIEGITVNVTVYDGLRKEVTDIPALSFTVKSESNREDVTNVTIVDGKLSATAFFPGEYSITIEGYYNPARFTVNRKDKEYSVTLYQIDDRFTIDNNDERVSAAEVEDDLQISFNNVAYNANLSKVQLVNDKITGENYMTEFTLQYDSFARWTGRVAIGLGTSSDQEKFLGLMFFGAGDTIKCNEYVAENRNLGEGNDFGRQPFELDSTKSAAIIAAIEGDGLKIRAVRVGNQLTVRMFIGNKWEKIWEKTVEGLSAEITLLASSPDCTATFSNISYFDSYTAETDVKYAYFTVGDKFVTADGDDATEAQLEIAKIEGITVNVTVYDGLRKVLSDTTGITLTLKDKNNRETVNDVTITDGKLSADSFYPGEYVIETDAFYGPLTFTVNWTDKEYSIVLYQIDNRFVISNNDNRVTLGEESGNVQIGFDHVNFHDYNPPVVTLINNKISGENYMTEFTVKYVFDAGKGWGYVQRFAVRLGSTSQNDKTFGFSFFAANDAEVQFSYATYGDGGFGEKGTKQPLEKDSDAAKAFVTALKGDGVTFRAVRNGDKLYLRAKVGNEWILVYETDATGLGAEISISASSNDSVCTVSNISYFDSYVAATNEKYAHFIKGDAYITADGDDTTLEKLDVVKIENLTINVKVYDKEGDDKQEVAAPTTAFSLYGDRAKITESNVTVEGGVSFR